MFRVKNISRSYYSFFFNIFAIIVAVSGRLPSISHRDSGIVSFCLVILAYLARYEVKAESKRIHDVLMLISPIAWFSSAMMSGLLYEEIIQLAILTKILFDRLPDLELLERGSGISKIVDHFCLTGVMGGLLCVLIAQFDLRITITTIMALLVSISSNKIVNYEKIITPFSLLFGVFIGGLAIDEISIEWWPFFTGSAKAMWLNFLFGPIFGLVLYDTFGEKIDRILGIVEE